MQTPLSSIATAAIAGLAATGISATSAMPRSAPHASTALATPALVAVDSLGGLEYWPVRRGGNDHPRQLSGPLGLGYAVLAADGNVVIAALQAPPQVLLYDVVSKSQTILEDPYGTPVDVAVGKDGSIYVVNVNGNHGNVVWYPASTMQPTELNCSLFDLDESIAVDNEGDIFVQGYGKHQFTGVIEFPNGPSGPQPQKCAKLRLRSENGTYVAGVAVDPKTDDLLTFDDPSLCAGGEEGRLTIYPKPYRSRSAHVRVLGGVCPGDLRLNADSTMVFYLDTTVSNVESYIRSKAYPSGRSLGIYTDRSSTGPGAVTTIPNSLPN